MLDKISIVRLKLFTVSPANRQGGCHHTLFIPLSVGNCYYSFYVTFFVIMINSLLGQPTLNCAFKQLQVYLQRLKMLSIPNFVLPLISLSIAADTKSFSFHFFSIIILTVSNF